MTLMGRFEERGLGRPAPFQYNLLFSELTGVVRRDRRYLGGGRKQPGAFPKSTIDLLETFADQSVLAIQNARPFHEIEEKSRELA